VPYLFAVEALDYSDFAAGRVLHSAPGQTAFPVRLADEIFRRALAARERLGGSGPATLYDPCCGSGYLLTTVAYLHWPRLRQIVGSDVDPEMVALTGRNLALLTPAGLRERAARVAELRAQFGKESHAVAMASAGRLEAQLVALRKEHDVPTRVFRADATSATDLLGNLGPRAVDLVITDVPHGQRSHWQTSDATLDPLASLLDALRPALAPRAVLAIASDKGQRPRHPAYARLGRLQLGKRQVTFLADAAANG
jgi:SAM-dependent methyltransferase